MAIDLFGFDCPQRICSTTAMRRENARRRMAEKRSTEQGRQRARLAVKEWQARNKNKVYEYRCREGKKRAIKFGREYKPIGKRPEKEIYSEELLSRNARDAFKWWMSKKSDAECARWYELSGNPWNNPRLTKAEQYRLRYKLDKDYNARERTRLYIKKQKRRRLVNVLSDNTVSHDIIYGAKCCLYCGVKFDDRVIRSMDHMIPISKGGQHTAANVVICCIVCNSKKGNLNFNDWVSTLDNPFRNNAVRKWKQLQRCNVGQRVMF